MKIFALLAPALCLALAGCDDMAVSVVCPDVLQPSVVVGVFNDQGEPVAHEARGWYTVGSVTDSLRHTLRTADVMQLAAYGPPGVYQVRVQRPGSPDWVISNLEVQDAECGPATRRLTAQLQPAE